MAATISLISDFGSKDSYVGEVKGVLAAASSARLIDITHSIPPFDTRWAALQLLQAYRYFPRSTYHLVLVDPGTGTGRYLYVKTKRYSFLGPDNGVLLWAVQACEHADKSLAQVCEIPLPKSGPGNFVGRDVLAPFLVQLLKRRIRPLKRLKWMEGQPFPVAKRVGNHFEGEILGFDAFGNAVTSISVGLSWKATMEVKGKRLRSVLRFHEIVGVEPTLIPGSQGFWEIVVQRGSAKTSLSLDVGDKVTLTPLE